MGWQLKNDPKWKVKIPVYRFGGGSGVVTRIGMEDGEGNFQSFLVKLHITEGIQEIVKEEVS